MLVKNSLNKSYPDRKMLFYLFFPKENQAPLKGIYANGHFRMRLDDLPGLLHALAPINIVENKYRVIMNMFEALGKSN